MKSYKEFINESNEIDRDVLDNLIDPIRDDIKDMLVDFVGYDIKFQLIDRDILDELRRVCDFIKTEIGFDYSGSYYHYNNSMGFSVQGKDIFKSGGKKVITSLSMFFEQPMMVRK